uniref:KASH domain-containing protein n=1 Tax=Ascaris lumbricoides TaxID=6252 RepID=A0A0M3IXD6_ASCLU
LDTWGSLIRLYGHEAQQKQQEAKRSQRSIIKLQGEHFTMQVASSVRLPFLVIYLWVLFFCLWNLFMLPLYLCTYRIGDFLCEYKV